MFFNFNVLIRYFVYVVRALILTFILKATKIRINVCIYFTDKLFHFFTMIPSILLSNHSSDISLPWAASLLVKINLGSLCGSKVQFAGMHLSSTFILVKLNAKYWHPLNLNISKLTTKSNLYSFFSYHFRVKFEMQSVPIFCPVQFLISYSMSNNLVNFEQYWQ